MDDAGRVGAASDHRVPALFVDGVVVQWNHGAAIPLFPHYPSITSLFLLLLLGTLDDPVPFSGDTIKGRDLKAVKIPGTKGVV